MIPFLRRQLPDARDRDRITRQPAAEFERVTRGLYWLIHDYEKSAYGDKARNRWTQAYSEMIETRVEDQLRQIAPQLIGGQRAFFTEGDLLAADQYGQRNAPNGGAVRLDHPCRSFRRRARISGAGWSPGAYATASRGCARRTAR